MYITKTLEQVGYTLSLPGSNVMLAMMSSRGIKNDVQTIILLRMFVFVV